MVAHGGADTADTTYDVRSTRIRNVRYIRHTIVCTGEKEAKNTFSSFRLFGFTLRWR